jgi:Cu2+-containing amine oxidase
MDEAGMSLSANFLTGGCDCRGEIFAFDGTLNDSVGRAMTILNAVCMHEVDYGIACKHTDCRTQEVAVRRSLR